MQNALHKAHKGVVPLSSNLCRVAPTHDAEATYGPARAHVSTGLGKSGRTLVSPKAEVSSVGAVPIP